MKEIYTQESDQAHEFYDQFYEKLLSDFVGGNPRMESALQFSCEQLNLAQSSRILDLGFGLGWSSFEFSRARTAAEIRGLDLSSKLTEIASEIFGSNPRICYECQDLTSNEWISRQSQNFDACVMLDVYEHIPAKHRQGFHRALGHILSADAILVMTCPTPAHQDYLRKENPQGLQPVDEDITFDDLLILAKSLDAEITHLEYVSIWMRNDYFHVTIARSTPATGAKPGKTKHRLIAHRERITMVKYAEKIIGKPVVEKVLSHSALKSDTTLKRLKRTLRKLINR
jgi:cyclopropane fatty-acyl-phospholipid synthase-like methyltransferase